MIGEYLFRKCLLSDYLEWSPFCHLRDKAESENKRFPPQRVVTEKIILDMMSTNEQQVCNLAIQWELLT